MHYAVEHDHQSVVELLLKKGADVFLEDKVINCLAFSFHIFLLQDSHSPLYYAIKNNFQHIVNAIFHHASKVSVMHSMCYFCFVIQ